MKSTLFFVLVWLRALCSAEIVVQTKLGGTTTLECTIFDSSSPLKWLRGTELIQSTNPKNGMTLRGKGEIVGRTRLRNDRELQISHVTLGDAGLFTCKVNDNEEHHRLVVSSASASQSGPVDVGSDVVLRCDVAGPVEGLVVRWRGPGGRTEDKATVALSPVTENDSGSWECEFTVAGKPMSETVNLQVREPRPKTTPAPPTTRGTQDNKALCVDCVPSTSSSQNPQGGLSWWVWAAIVGGFVIVLLWVLVLVMYNQITRRKRRFMKLRKGRPLRADQYCRCPCPTAATSHSRTKPGAPAFPAPAREVP